MNKMLYITDQQEYSENGTISTLFDIYLKKHWNVHIVYMTNFKHSFQEKGTHYIVPSDKQSEIMRYLEAKSIDLSIYDFVFVRNKLSVLKDVLKYKKTYSYKIAFRVSYPIHDHQLEYLDAPFPFSIFKKMKYTNKLKARDELINQCDLFLPASIEAKAEFYNDININSFPVYTGLDPDELNEHVISTSDITKFIYVGSINKIREFNVILDALLKIEDPKWHLTISTTDKAYISSLLKQYVQLKNNISLVSAMSIKDLREQINQNDIGIALLPRNKFCDTILADKVIDYYSCSLPTLLTTNEKNHSIFDNDEAFFCDFEVNSIANKIQVLMDTTSSQDAIIGNKGQKKLLALKRNYKTLAKSLAATLDEIVAK